MLKRRVSAILCLVVASGTLLTSGQSHQGDVLPAPTTENRADNRNAGDSSEPHGYTNRIVGGKVSSGRPFIAALLYQKDGKLYQYCGASVIGDRWLLTAAHCQVKKGELAVIDRSDLSSPGIPLRIERVFPHQQYSQSTQNNDIALLYLSGQISSAIHPVTLAAPPPPTTRVIAAGWGRTSENGKSSLQLREVEVPIVPHKDCKDKYRDLTDNMVCAGEKGKDSCQGDSGGPLFKENGGVVQQFGIVSKGLGCGRDGEPGVYTEVDQYQTWITTTVNNL